MDYNPKFEKQNFVKFSQEKKRILLTLNKIKTTYIIKENTDKLGYI